MSSLARRERDALADALATAGPGHPTLCEGWTTRELAAHLVVRDRRIDAQAGAVIPGLHWWTDWVTRGEARGREYGELVRLVRAGGPAWTPVGLPVVGDLVNLVEMYVHHEDIRRAVPHWAPRPLDPALEEAIWLRLRVLSRWLFRRSPVGVVLRRSGGKRQEIAAHAGDPRVIIVGPPSELVLFAYGRKAQARVAFEGDRQAVERFRRISLKV